MKMSAQHIHQQDIVEENVTQHVEQRGCLEEKVLVNENDDLRIDIPIRGDPLSSPSHEWSIPSSTECVDVSFSYTY